MQTRMVAGVALLLCGVAVLAYLANAPEQASTSVEPTPTETSRTTETQRRDERRPRQRHAEEAPPSKPSEEPASSQAWDETWRQAAQVDARTARELAPLLAELLELYLALHESGALTTEECVLTRIEWAFNECMTTSGETRKRARSVIDGSAQSLEIFLQRKVESGLLAGGDAKATNSAVAALRSALGWFDTTRSQEALPDPAATAGREGETAPAPRAKRDRSAIVASLREARTRGLKEEAAILNRLLASDASAIDRGERTVAQVRLLVVRARLGEIEFAAARQQAEALLAGAANDVDPTTRQNVRGLIGLLDWYGSSAMRTLYGE